MTSIGENAKRDIYLTGTKNLALVTGLDECGQSCKSAVEVVLGECVLNLDHGLPYDQTMWTQYLPRSFEAAARKAILAVLNVQSVLSFDLQRAGDRATYQAVIKTNFGLVSVAGVIPGV
jgi:hypothetical protein